MNTRTQTKHITIAALLIAIGILIPMISPLKIILEPASFTLASHVATMIAHVPFAWHRGCGRLWNGSRLHVGWLSVGRSPACGDAHDLFVFRREIYPKAPGNGP